MFADWRTEMLADEAYLEFWVVLVMGDVPLLAVSALEEPPPPELIQVPLRRHNIEARFYSPAVYLQPADRGAPAHLLDVLGHVHAVRA